MVLSDTLLHATCAPFNFVWCFFRVSHLFFAMFFFIIVIIFSPAGAMSHALQPWFAGQVSRNDVPDLLKKDGDFLVRDSENTPGAYVLSVR